MLRIRNLQAGYGKLRVLRGVSLHVKEGEIVTLIGANGAGKTTLLHTITGLVSARGGEIQFGGTDLTQLAAYRIVGQGCALVPEGRQMFAVMTVDENLRLGAYSRQSRDSAGVEATLAQVYRLFPVLQERRKQYAGTLSGGEQQMVAIGRALMAKPRLIMLDEPSMGLAPLVVKEIFKTITGLRETGVTILLVEQNAKAALSIADRGYVMETGTIFMEGAARDLLNNNDVQRAYLGKDYKSIGERNLPGNETQREPR
jgi:branched-chain amino acid transport system ATP-binding protein